MQISAEAFIFDDVFCNIVKGLTCVANRTPAPAAISGMNSTPTFSRVATSVTPVSGRPPMGSPTIYPRPNLGLINQFRLHAFRADQKGSNLPAAQPGNARNVLVQQRVAAPPQYPRPAIK